MKVTAEQYESLLDRLAAELYVPDYDPATMVTAKDLAERLKVTKTIAAYNLDRLVSEGGLEKIEVRFRNGQKGNAYVQPNH